MDTMKTGKSFGFGTLLQHVWEVCTKSALHIFVPFLILKVLLILGDQFSLPILDATIADIMVQPVYGTLSMIVYGALRVLVIGYVYIAIHDYWYAKQRSFHERLHYLLQRFPYVFLVSVVVSVLFILGYFAFLLPGVLILFYLIFAPVDSVTSKNNIGQSLKMSVRLVNYHGWFPTFFMLVGVFIIASFIQGLDVLLVHSRALPQAIRTYDSLSLWQQSTLMASNVIFGTLYYGIAAAGIVSLFVAYHEMYKSASTELREAKKGIGCAAYGCLGFGVFGLAIVILLFVGLFRLGRQYLPKVIDNTAIIMETAVPSETDLLHRDEKKEEWKTVVHDGGGVIQFDEGDLQSMLSEFIYTTNLSGVGSSIEMKDGIMTYEVSIPVPRIPTMTDGTGYINLHSSFILNMQDDQAMLTVYTGSIGSTDWFNVFLGDTNFFWTDTIEQQKMRQSNPEHKAILEEFKRVKSILMSGDVLQLEIE